MKECKRIKKKTLVCKEGRKNKELPRGKEIGKVTRRKRGMRGWLGGGEV